MTLTKKDFKNERDWFNLGREIQHNWKDSIMIGGDEGRGEINNKGLSRMAKKFNATQEVIRIAHGVFLYDRRSDGQ